MWILALYDSFQPKKPEKRPKDVKIVPVSQPDCKGVEKNQIPSKST
jgi:hypothetical protein